MSQGTFGAIGKLFAGCAGDASPNPWGEKGWLPAQLGDLSGRTYVVTGTTSGCGLEASRLLLSKGAAVIMANRSREKSDKVVAAFKGEFGADAKVSAVLLDLSRLESVRSGAAEVLEAAPRIDALILNAAIAQVARQELTADGFESQMGVNYFAQFLLTGLLFRRIEESEGRVVSVGSGAYKMGLCRIKFEDVNFDQGYDPMTAYCQSKLAQTMFGYELQRRLERSGSRAQSHVCHPGASRTELCNRDNVASSTKLLLAMLTPIIAQSAAEGAYPEVLCATESTLKPRTYYGPTKMSETHGPVGECPLEAHALDEEEAAKLWALSEKETGLAWSP